MSDSVLVVHTGGRDGCGTDAARHRRRADADMTYADAEIILLGVEEPLAAIHAPNESVDPSEIQAMALAEALFLQRYAGARCA